MKHLLSISSIAVSLIICMSSCFPKDEQVEPHVPGLLTTAQVALGDDYANIVYFSLKNNASVKMNAKTDWDLGFSCNDTLNTLSLNTARFMKAANTGLSSISDINTVASLNFHFNASSGNTDSTAFGGWNAPGTSAKQAWLKKLFVIDMGLDLKGISLGYSRLFVDSVNATAWYIKASPSLVGNMQRFVITKDSHFNFTGFNLSNSQQVNYEPDKDSYDLYFGSYSTLLFTEQGAPYPYLLTGVLTNKHRCLAKRLLNIPFDSVSLRYAASQSFSGNLDEIGYDWKTYSFDLGSYAITPNRVYLIKTTDGLYYVLRFIGFLNDQGIKGYPRFEFKPL